MQSVVVKESAIEGLGVFARRPFRPDETVLVLDTTRLVDESHPLRPGDGEREDHLAFLADGRVALLPTPERHLNHCCDPNAFVRTVAGETRIVARRPIAAGEEVTLDYVINTDGGGRWPCRCGAARCRGLLESSFFDLPRSLQLEYLPLLEPAFARRHAERLRAIAADPPGPLPP